MTIVRTYRTATIVLILNALPALAEPPRISLVFGSDSLEAQAVDILSTERIDDPAQGAALFIRLSPGFDAAMLALTSAHVGDTGRLMICGEVVVEPVLYAPVNEAVFVISDTDPARIDRLQARLDGPACAEAPGGWPPRHPAPDLRQSRQGDPMPDIRAPRLAVLIDADNIPARHIEAVLDELAAYGEPSVRRVYGDWSSSALGQWKEKARNLGLVMHQQSANTKGKNASDIGLVIDAMDILHAGKVDGFVLVSSDSDFTRLASRIREDGLQVIGVGEKKTPESLRNVCNRFLFLENIAATPEPAADTPTPAKPAKEPAKAEKDPPSKAIPLVLAAMKKIGIEEDSYSLGQLGQVLTQLYPDFDSRSYGSAKLSDLLKRTGRFDVAKGEGNHLVVRDKA